jgi:hypothetical protein
VSAGSIKSVSIQPVPAADSRRRARIAVICALGIAAVLVVVPALLLRPMRGAGALGFTLGPVIAFCLDLLPGLSNARGTTRRFSSGSRYLTAPTWTGMRTLDLNDLRSVRARLIAGRFGTMRYVVVQDGAGSRMSFSGKKDLELVRHAIKWHQARKHAPHVEVSRLAAGIVGLTPRRRGLEALGSLWSAVPLMVAILAIAGAITALAA